jgi:predicted transposase YbfD/YdcC
MKMEEGFLDFFSSLDDPRSTRNRLYTMSEILLCTLSAAICGAEGWQDVEDFGKAKIDYLRQYLPYKNGIPSDDTVRRFYRALDPEHFQELFRSWIKSLHIKSGNESVIAIDGKASRHSFDGSGNMLHMVSAYATEARLVLAQEKVSEKSNEITAIPKLIEWLDIKGNIITIDAMGCQFEIGELILKKEGHYIFSLKGNQGNFFDDIQLFLNDPKQIARFEQYEDYDKGHGRIETRTCWVCHDVAWLQEAHPRWKSIKSIIRIDSVRDIKGKITTETRFYISSMITTPQKFLAAIRSHWAIENNLHWVLDMSFDDDHSRIRKQNAPQVMAVVRHIALNLLQLTKNQMKRQSIKRLRKNAGWDDSVLTTILSQNFS